MLVLEKYRITRENIYNFDEKKFIIGMSITLVWVITYEEFKSGEIIEISQYSNKV